MIREGVRKIIILGSLFHEIWYGQCDCTGNKHQVKTQNKSGSCYLCIIPHIYTYLGLNDRYNAQAAVSIAIACFQNVINRLEDWHTDYLHSPPRPHARSGGDITLATFKMKPFYIFTRFTYLRKAVICWHRSFAAKVYS